MLFMSNEFGITAKFGLGVDLRWIPAKIRCGKILRTQGLPWQRLGSTLKHSVGSWVRPRTLSSLPASLLIFPRPRFVPFLDPIDPLRVP